MSSDLIREGIKTEILMVMVDLPLCYPNSQPDHRPVVFKFSATATNLLISPCESILQPRPELLLRPLQDTSPRLRYFPECALPGWRLE